MALAGQTFRSFFGRTQSDESVLMFGQAARNVGVTTVADLGTSNLLDEAVIRQWIGLADETFPMRTAMFHGALMSAPDGDEACAAARTQLAQYQSAGRLVERDPDGNERELNADERASLVETAQARVDADCEVSR